MAIFSPRISLGLAVLIDTSVAEGAPRPGEGPGGTEEDEWHHWEGAKYNMNKVDESVKEKNLDKIVKVGDIVSEAEKPRHLNRGATMKQVFQLDDLDLDLLKKGHIFDIVLNGIAYGLSYQRHKGARGKYKKIIERSKKQKPLKALDRKQYDALYGKYFKPLSNGLQCKLCDKSFTGVTHPKIAANTHFRRTHPKEWRKR